jgi:hypothetical protein
LEIKREFILLVVVTLLSMPAILPRYLMLMPLLWRASASVTPSIGAELNNIDSKVPVQLFLMFALEGFQ